ncbi:MAG TPA: 5-methyltetrahydropteroyltriglutamate--homocysteine S-methyltransferase [Burkholderiales bacterium]|nr:5-methyltetrahydropteroyltriglutamate--homocysteine S-methyltransferase [Burkholderiales bacterium]
MSELDRVRTDVVGSLLRPAAWKEARLRFEAGLMPAHEFALMEDGFVKANLALQEAVGLDVVTDGELSRLNFQDSFGLSVSGYDTARETVATQERRAAGGAPLSRWEIPDLAAPGTPVVHRRPVKERLQLTRNVPLEEYLRASPHARKPVKVTLVGPDRIAQRFDHAASRNVYPSIDDFMADVVAVQRQMIAQLAAAGCRYVHIDAPGYTAYVDPPSLAAMRARGEDPEATFSRSLAADAAVVAGFPGVTFGIHLCRGNQRSMWHREGAYDAIAERLFGELPHQRFLLEYDSPRAGSFAPLRFVPRGRTVVLGLVSSKVPELEPLDEIRRRVDEAARLVPLEQLALSPQCGFGSDAVGNLVSEDDQKRKLERVVEAARTIWGK